MRSIGRVIELLGSEATVCFEPGEACKKCDAGTLCHGAGSKHTVLVENPLGAQVGDNVCVEQSPRKALLSAFIVFGLPVLLAVLGLVVGARWAEAWSIILGITGFVIGLIIAKILDNMLVRKKLWLPRITEIRKKEGS
jgi:sigma-E factor negative regulatory protein RseC